MKITDEELIQAIWDYQIFLLCDKVVCRYVGGKYGVESDSEFNKQHSISIHRCNRANITDKISSPQILARMRKLVKQGILLTDPFECIFFLNAENADGAFLTARRHWLGYGIPEGYDAENKCMRTTEFNCYDEALSDIRWRVSSLYRKPKLVSKDQQGEQYRCQKSIY